MACGIRMRRLYDDDGFSQVEIVVEDERAWISLDAYVNQTMLTTVAATIEGFTDIVPGARFDITIGHTAEEFAGGGVNIACRVSRHGDVVLTVLARSGYGEAGARQFGDVGLEHGAAELRTMLVTEPGQLDRFARELRGFCTGFQESCELTAQGGWFN